MSRHSCLLLPYISVAPVLPRTCVTVVKIKFTQRTVEALKPKNKRFVVWDEETKGFGVRVNQDGSKTFVVEYFVNGRQRWLSIGNFGVLTTENARK